MGAVTRWEYLEVVLPDYSDTARAKALNELGALGWEAFGVYDTGATYVWLKRPVTEPSG